MTDHIADVHTANCSNINMNSDYSSMDDLTTVRSTSGNAD